MMGNKGRKGEMTEKVLDVDASMQGRIAFKDPVNLKINGKFEGSLSTKGYLTVGDNAEVKADITGDNITVSGRVDGNIIAQESLRMTKTGKIFGNIETPSLSVDKGALLYGNCKMSCDDPAAERISASRNKKDILNAGEVAKYLTVDPSLVEEWAKSGKLPANMEEGQWRFDRREVDEWVQTEKIK